MKKNLEERSWTQNEMGGHVNRRADDRLPRRLWHAEERDKQRRGSLKMRWEDRLNHIQTGMNSHRWVVIAEERMT